MRAFIAVAITVSSLLGTHPMSPAMRTCAAFRVWDEHRTAVHLDAMLTASEHAPWRNLGNDVDVVYADVRDGDRYDLPGDIAGIKTDCRI